jgi:IS30 family transposase
VPKAAKVGRSYDDFLAYTQKHGVSSWVEMDTVIGRIGGKVILTLDFTFCNFMAGILLEDKTAIEVTEKINRLKNDLTANGLRFGDIFPIILTDNGGEFANIRAVENDLRDQKETQLFVCDPCKSYQKPKVEKNHTLLRDIVPKGTSFDTFSQDTVNLIFSHVNSIMRKGLNGKSAYEVFVFTHAETVAAVLGISQIPAEKVMQSPKLLMV